VVGRKDLKATQDELAEVKAANEVLVAENAALKEVNSALTAENQILNIQIKHKDELFALHNYYNDLRSKEQ
jgi:hypothetical protein